MRRDYVFAIDVDGVLRNSLPEMIKLYNQTFGTSMMVGDCRHWDVSIDFPLIAKRLGEPAWKWFFVEHATDLFFRAPTCFNARSAMEILTYYGKIIIVTSQTGYENKRLTLSWLELHGIPFDSIVFSSDKSFVKADFFLDDHPENFEGSDARCICVDAPHNQGYEGERVNSLDIFVVKFAHGEYETTTDGQLD